MYKKSIVVVLFSLLLIACNTKSKRDKQPISNIEPVSIYQPKYAKGFCIKYFNGYRQLVLNDPWGDSTKIETIALVEDSNLIEDLAKTNDFVIGYPATKWIALSSTMVNYADKLNAKQTICGVAEPQYIADDYIQKAIADGKIKNVGMAVAPDIEVLVDVEPDFMMVSPFKDNHFTAVTGAGIPVITNADYMEHTPLGRAEWLVFMGELLGEGNKAKQQFAQIEEAYLSVKAKAKKVNQQPSVFTGHIYQGIWYTPAGESYMANFFKDAGCNYIYNDSKGTGSLALDYEIIIDKAEHTDYWVLIINHPTEIAYSEIAKIDERYMDFDAFKNRKMVVTNTAHSLYFEKGLLRPHIVLADLVAAVHPGVLEDYTPSYFHLLTKE